MTEPYPAPGADSDKLTAFSPERPLVLLTDFPPDHQGGGAVILKSLLTPDDRRRMVWVTLSRYEPQPGPRVISLAPPRYRSLLQDGTVRTAELRRETHAVIREYSAAAAWVVAHGAAVRIAPALMAAGLPVHMTVHDDPAWAYALLTRRYVPLAPLLLHDFYHGLRGAKSLDVVCEAMARRYRPRCTAEPAIVHRGLSSPVDPSPEYDRHGGISVAVLGSTYGLREVSVLANALAKVSDRLNVPARLTLIGSVRATSVRRLCPPNVALELTGHLTESEGIARLRTSFLLYLSYPFGPRGRVLRRTSFPTKLSTYVMAARPLLLHMPADSSVAFLREGTPYSTLWDSLDSEEGAKIMERLWLTDRTHASFDLNAEMLRVQHFDLAHNRSVLFRALNALPRGTLAAATDAGGEITAQAVGPNNDSI
jgi:hypothetical protein